MKCQSPVLNEIAVAFAMVGHFSWNRDQGFSKTHPLLRAQNQKRAFRKEPVPSEAEGMGHPPYGEATKNQQKRWASRPDS
jgi:hypothetical protein